MPTVLPYGTWPSPISGTDIAAASAHYEDLVAADGAVLWTRTERATGDLRLHRWTPEGGVEDLAGDLNVNGRVHEYGSGAIMAGHDTIVVVDFDEQRLHRVHADGTTTPITDATDANVRFGAGQLVDADTLVVVRETHHGTSAVDVANELVLVDLVDGSQVVLVDDHDFVGDPALGPGGRIAWITWDHPSMPWDSTVLWSARLFDGGLEQVTRVAGGDDVSVADWAFDGEHLTWSDDRTGFWEVYRQSDDHPDGHALTSAGFDLGRPRWMLGPHSLAVADGRVLVVGTRDARSLLGEVGDGGWNALDDVVVVHVVADGGLVATMDFDEDGGRAVRVRHDDGSVRTLDQIDPPSDRPGDVGQVVAIAVGDGDELTHAFLHPPANADAIGPDDELPPLVVFIHGGPTGNVMPVPTAQHLFWTTRGFAVVDVNYRGSTGFGRDYRRLMRGRWGEIEVADVIAVADELADRGLVDRDRMAIRGGSAGGFTALAAVTQPQHPFACATSFFGVSDLAALAEHTHKFESRYLDSMVGELPRERDVYTRRSPLANVDNLAVPILVLQGLDDKVVPPAQAEAVVAAARERGVAHAHLTFEGEGHGFRKPHNITTWLQSELAFYGEVMGFTPHGDVPDVLGTSPAG